MTLPKVTFSGAAMAAGWLVAGGMWVGSATSSASNSADRIVKLEKEVAETREVNKQTAERLSVIETYLVLILKANGITPNLRRQSEAPAPWNG